MPPPKQKKQATARQKHGKPYSFAEARLCCQRLMPYMTNHVMSLVPVQKPGLGTMGVDESMRCYYDPAILEEWTIEEAAGVILHEDLHVLLRHCKRAKATIGERPSEEEVTRWNWAVDFVVNQILRDANTKMPDGVLYPEDFGFPKNLTAEEYYHLLEQKIPPQGKQEQQPVLGGSGADGQKKEWEAGKQEGDQEDGKDQGQGQGTQPGLGEVEQEMLARQVAREVEEREKAKGRGTVPGYLSRMAEEILRPKTDPVRELLAQVKYAINAVNGFGDYTWKNMNRRCPPGGMRLPAHVQPIPRVTVICDTSGSMGAEDLALSLGVVSQVLKGLPGDGVTVVCGDASLQSAQRCFRADQVQMVGGGGTSMRRVIEESLEGRRKPDVIVVCTDGETDWPIEPVGPRVVACLTRKSDSYPVPDWLKAVEIRP